MAEPPVKVLVLLRSFLSGYNVRCRWNDYPVTDEFTIRPSRRSASCMSDICGVHFRQGVAIAFPVPAGVSNQSMNMRVPVDHATEGLWNEDTTWKNIPAIKGFMKKYRKRIPGTFCRANMQTFQTYASKVSC